MTSPTVFLDERYMLRPEYETRNYDLATDSRTMDFPASGIKIAGTAMSASAAELNKMDGVTASTTELNLLVGASATTPAGGKAAILDSAGALRTLENVGTTPGTVTAVEYGDGYNHVTVLTVTAAVLVPDLASADLETGALIYTFPAGVHRVNMTHLEVTAASVAADAGNADVGCGSTLAAGATATLGATTDEDFINGLVVADMTSPSVDVTEAGDVTIFASGDSKLFHLNVASGWSGANADPSITGTVTIAWTFMGA